MFRFLLLPTVVLASTYRFQTVAYWGQNSAGIVYGNDKSKWEKPLYQYCKDSTWDILVLAFVNIFPDDQRSPDDAPTLNFAYHCETTFSQYPLLLNCPNLGKNIKRCQRKGKKILLSIGGATGPYGFQTDAQAEAFAQKFWDMFMAGKNINSPRPFGDAIVDGVDLDIESGGKTGYVAFVNKLRSLYAKDMSPQCVYPDAHLGPSDGAALQEAHFDFVFIQHYNNFCGVQNYNNPNAFNFQQWVNWAKTVSVNKNVKVFLGVPGHPQDAGSGYIDAAKLKTIIKDLSKNYRDVFGGVMMWEASLAGLNQVGSSTYASAISSFVKSLPGTNCPTKPPSSKPPTKPPTSKPPSSKPPTSKPPSSKPPTSKPPVNNCSVRPGSPCNPTIDMFPKCAKDNDGFVQCLENKWVLQPCGPGTTCKPSGGTIICDFPNSPRPSC